MVDIIHVVVEEANESDERASNHSTHQMVPWSNIHLMLPVGKKTIRLYMIRYDEVLLLENIQLRGGTIVTIVIEVEVIRI